jgi:hypothetical protein
LIEYRKKKKATKEKIKKTVPTVCLRLCSKIRGCFSGDLLDDEFNNLARWTSTMSIIAAYNEAWDTANVEALGKIIHDDCVFNPHVGGHTMSKSDILGFVSGGSTPTSEHNRILFENDEVGVAHSIVHFANDSDSEAVMSFMRFKDGQIISMETGATPLSDDYKLVGSE